MLNESRRTSKQVIFYSTTNKMIMVHLPSLSAPGSTRLQSSVNIYHILKILRLDNMDKFSRIVSRYFTSSDKRLHMKMLDLLCKNKANFNANTDSVAIISAMLPNSSKLTGEEKESMVLLKIQEELFVHLGNYFTDMDAQQGMIYRSTNRTHLLALSTAMLLERETGVRSETDRDSWSNKRIEASSKAMEYLLRNAWSSKLTVLSKTTTASVDSPLYINKAITQLNKSLITDTFISSQKKRRNC